jgi:hypothetical protein
MTLFPVEIPDPYLTRLPARSQIRSGTARHLLNMAGYPGFVVSGVQVSRLFYTSEFIMFQRAYHVSAFRRRLAYHDKCRSKPVVFFCGMIA